MIRTKIDVSGTEFIDYQRMNVTKVISDNNTSSYYDVELDSPYGRHKNDFEVGQEIKIVAQTQIQNQGELETGIQKIQSRSGFAKFFIGPNYSEIKSSQKLLEQNREQIQKLNEARTQIVNQGDQLQVIEQIQALEQVNQQIETLLSESQKGFSLFGWLFRIFSR